MPCASTHGFLWSVTPKERIAPSIRQKLRNIIHVRPIKMRDSTVLCSWPMAKLTRNNIAKWQHGMALPSSVCLCLWNWIQNIYYLIWLKIIGLKFISFAISLLAEGFINLSDLKVHIIELIIALRKVCNLAKEWGWGWTLTQDLDLRLDYP